jgi:hypothetical protein|tara:strand:- start:479 stop:976 length:498 start_codon:yes stop_codon:yes gene_type:complete
MERKLNSKANTYFTEYKNYFAQLIKNTTMNVDEKNKIINQIYEYKRFEITKEDLQKRKRVKNSIPLHERCNALRANKEQCTRRKKEECKFCGTHTKGTPHGVIDVSKVQESFTKVKVWQQDINGILYFLDKNFNVYDPQDVQQNNTNPKIIAKYTILPGDKFVLI